MKKRLIALGVYSMFWLTFFFFARLFFIAIQYESSFKNGAGELLATFINGLKLDISTTGYYMLIPVLLAIPGIWFTGNRYKLITRWYSFILILFSSLIVVADANLYSYWGFRMDYTPVMYLKTPAEAMASVSTIKAAGFFLTIIAISSLFIFVYRRTVDNFFDGLGRVRSRLFTTLFFIILILI